MSDQDEEVVYASVGRALSKWETLEATLSYPMGELRSSIKHAKPAGADARLNSKILLHQRHAKPAETGELQRRATDV